MAHTPSVTVKRWTEITPDEFFEIVRLRTEVFYVEQRIDVPDFDDLDRNPTTMHYWIADEAGCAAYLRVVELTEPEHDAGLTFGRVAVRADQRGRGLARVLIQRVIDARGDEAMTIHSQEYVVPLYASFGFEVVGELYYEAGLPHLMMHRRGDAPASELC